MSPISFDEASREYLDFSKDLSEAEIFGLLTEYLQHLYEDSEEVILLEDFSVYEADDFINFYLQEFFEGEELLSLQKRSLAILNKFMKFLEKKKYIHKEAVEEWKEVMK